MVIGTKMCGCMALPHRCEDQNVHIVFALTRKRLGQIYGCRKRVSAVALLDYHGVEALHLRMIELMVEGHEVRVRERCRFIKACR